ncbi:MAG: hypothetical protein RR382_11835 [Tannerellaceae bacterium]
MQHTIIGTKVIIDVVVYINEGVNNINEGVDNIIDALVYNIRKH